MQIHVGLATLGFASQDIYFYLFKIFHLKVCNARELRKIHVGH